SDLLDDRREQIPQTERQQDRGDDNENDELSPFLHRLQCWFARGLSLFLEFFPFLLDAQELFRIGGDNLIFGVRRDDLNSSVFLSREENSFPESGFEQKIFFRLREQEDT